MIDWNIILNVVIGMTLYQIAQGILRGLLDIIKDNDL